MIKDNFEMSSTSSANLEAINPTVSTFVEGNTTILQLVFMPSFINRFMDSSSLLKRSFHSKTASCSGNFISTDAYFIKSTIFSNS